MGRQQSKAVSAAVGDFEEEKEKPRVHQAVSQSRRLAPCPMSFSLLNFEAL